jgi:hypothetical protein
MDLKVGSCINKNDLKLGNLIVKRDDVLCEAFWRGWYKLQWYLLRREATVWLKQPSGTQSLVNFTASGATVSEAGAAYCVISSSGIKGLRLIMRYSSSLLTLLVVRGASVSV